MKKKEKIKKEYQEFLDKEGYGNTFLKKNARVLFNTKHGKITDLIVEEFENSDSKQHLYEKYNLDIGNCLYDWDNWTFSDILIKIFVCYQVPCEVRKKIIFELSKVKEWRPKLEVWITRNWIN